MMLKKAHAPADSRAAKAEDFARQPIISDKIN
jgi:hypothetical protein